MLATSHLTGKKVNRFTHIHQSPEDLVKKVKMQRLLGQKTGSCFQRCVGMDAINALYSDDLRDRPGEGHHLPRALQELRAVPAGQRPRRRRGHDRPEGRPRLSPHQQPDPDLYLHVVERRDDGIVVRGAKAHQTGACNSHEILVMPTVAMREGDEDYAVSFSCPAERRGRALHLRPSELRHAQVRGDDLDVGNCASAARKR